MLLQGVYVLRDDLQLGSIPPHPSDNIVTNPNVLDPKPVPPTAGTRLSLATLAPRRVPCYLPRTPIKNTAGSLFPPNITESRHELSQYGGEHEMNSWTSRATGNFRAFAFGETNAALSPTSVKDSKDQLKRKKPKNNINKSSSSFVSRVILHDAFNKHIQEHNPEGLFAFANINRALLWLDLSSSNKVCYGLPLSPGLPWLTLRQAEQLTKILFTKGHALCHDFNSFTRTLTHLDIIIGFSSGDIIWYEPISQKYARLNKNVIIHI